MEPTRNIRRRREQGPALDPRDHRDDNPSITVYSNQRVQARNQRHHGVAQFLTNMGQMMGDRARQEVLDSAQSDALSGDVDEEMLENNWLYRGVIREHQGRTDGIRLAAQTQASLEEAYRRHRQERPNDPFDLDSFLDGHFGSAAENPLWENRDYRNSLLTVRQNLEANLRESVERLDARAVVEEGNNLFSDLAHNAMEASNAASLSDIRDMLLAVGDDIGLTHKDIRSTVVESYLTQITQSDNVERIDSLEQDLRTWLRGTDRGLLRDIEGDLVGAVTSAKAELVRQQNEARAEQVTEVDGRLLNLEFNIKQNPSADLLVELTQLRDQGLLGINDTENRNNFMRLSRMTQDNLLREQSRSQTELEQAQRFHEIAQAINTEDPVAHLLLSPEAQAQIPAYFDHQLSVAIRSPRAIQGEDGETIELPSLLELTRQYIEQPSPQLEQEFAIASANIATILSQSREFGHTPSVIQELIGDYDPAHPRFAAAARWLENITSHTGSWGLGLSDRVVGRYEAFNHMVRMGMDNAQAIELMSRNDQVISATESRQLLNSALSDRQIDLSFRRGMGGRRAVNQLVNQDHLMMQARNLAAEMYRFNQSDPQGLFERAVEMVAARTEVIDGFAFSQRDVGEVFSMLYNERGGSFRDSIDLTLREELGSLAPESWVLRPASNAGRQGLVTVFNEDGVPVIDPNTGMAYTINPNELAYRYLNQFSEAERERRIQLLRDARDRNQFVELAGRSAKATMRRL